MHKPGKSPGGRQYNMDRLISYVVRVVVWLSAFVKPLSRLGLFRYDEWHKGQPLKVLLVGYNGARNTGADARVVALTQQLEQAFGADQTQLTVTQADCTSFRKPPNLLNHPL